MQLQEITLKNKHWFVMFGFVVVFMFAEDMLHDAIWETKEGFLNVNIPVWTLIGLIIIGGVLHELLHGLMFTIFSEKGHQSVRYKLFSISPSCHCKEPLTRIQYMTGLIVPLIILGVLPIIMGYYYRIEWLRTFGILFTIAAGSDLWFFIYLLFSPGNFVVIDHPDKAGFFKRYDNGSSTKSIHRNK